MKINKIIVVVALDLWENNWRGENSRRYAPKKVRDGKTCRRFHSTSWYVYACARVHTDIF